jgi:hypothetical protein
VGVPDAPGQQAPAVPAGGSAQPSQPVGRRRQHLWSGDDANPSMPQPVQLAAEQMRAGLVGGQDGAADQLVPADDAHPTAAVHERA